MTGSLQEKNGKYYAVINVKDSTGKRKAKWISTGYSVRGNKKRAEQFLREKLREYELNQNIVSSDVTFAEYLGKWLSLAKLKLEESTYLSYCCIMQAHIMPYFEATNIKLNKISRNDIQRYINQKFANGRRDGKGGLSAKSVKSHMVIIRQALTEAVKEGYIANNPCDYTTLPKLQKFEAGFYSEKQMRALLNAIKDERLFPLVYITAILGLRRSEVLGLKWDSIDFDSHILTIKHVVVGMTKVIEKDSTKNKASNRSYPMNEEVEKLLLSLKEKETENRKLFGNTYNENDYVFKWDNGNPYKPDYISSAFKKLLEKYSLPKIRFHDLRHSCASLLNANGCSLKDIQEWLGHSDIQTTANIYTHLNVERKASIMETMEKTISL